MGKLNHLLLYDKIKQLQSPNAKCYVCGETSIVWLSLMIAHLKSHAQSEPSIAGQQLGLCEMSFPTGLFDNLIRGHSYILITWWP